MRVDSWRTRTVIGVVSGLLLAGAYAVWATRDRASENDAGWLDSLDTVQGAWVSNDGVAYDGTEPWTTPVLLTITGDELRLHAACNHLSAQVTLEDHRLSAVDGIVSTKIGCSPELAARDAWLAALISDRASVQLKGSTEGPRTCQRLLMDSWVGGQRVTWAAA